MCRARRAGMVRLTFGLATLLSVSACFGPSRTPGRVTNAIVTGAGLIMTVGGVTRDCTRGSFDDALACDLQAGIGTIAGVALLAIGASGLVYNELRTPPTQQARPCDAW